MDEEEQKTEGAEATEAPAEAPEALPGPEEIKNLAAQMLALVKKTSDDEEKAGVPHYKQTKHTHDVPHPAGMQRVRVDGGGSTTPPIDRRYELVRAGYGEGRRARMVRGLFTEPPAPPTIVHVPHRHGMTETVLAGVAARLASHPEEAAALGAAYRANAERIDATPDAATGEEVSHG